jgi:hypothetical protein
MVPKCLVDTLLLRPSDQTPWGPGSNLLYNDEIAFLNLLIDRIGRSVEPHIPTSGRTYQALASVLRIVELSIQHNLRA